MEASKLSLTQSIVIHAGQYRAESNIESRDTFTIDKSYLQSDGKIVITVPSDGKPIIDSYIVLFLRPLSVENQAIHQPKSVSWNSRFSYKCDEPTISIDKVDATFGADRSITVLRITLVYGETSYLPRIKRDITLILTDEIRKADVI